MTPDELQPSLDFFARASTRAEQFPRLLPQHPQPARCGKTLNRSSFTTSTNWMVTLHHKPRVSSP